MTQAEIAEAARLSTGGSRAAGPLVLEPPVTSHVPETMYTPALLAGAGGLALVRLSWFFPEV